MAKGGDTPTPPDPTKIIPVQGQENRNTFDYQTYQGRTNVNTPYGTSSWSRTPVFDQAGYDRATSEWQAKQNPGSQGVWQDEIPGHYEGQNWIQTIPGQWTGATGPTSVGEAPSRDAFTNYSWTNDQTLNDREQGIFDANRDSAADIARTLPGLSRGAADSLSHGPNYSNIPGLGVELGLTSEADLRSMGLLGNWLDTTRLKPYERYGPEQRLGQVRSGDINRGAIDQSYDEVAAPDSQIRDWTSMGGFGSNVRDWASMLAPGVLGQADELSRMNPWEYDQQGADASYSQATRYLDVNEAKTKSSMEARLAEQGFVPGTPAFNQAMGEFMNSSNLTRADARDRALLAGREYGNQAFDNRQGSLKESIASLLDMGQFGVDNDVARDNSWLDMAGFGLDNDTARSKEGLDIADFMSGERQFGANYGLKAQGQDFDQQKYLSEQERERGMDANQVVTDQIGLDRGRTDQNNQLSADELQNYLDGADLDSLIRQRNAGTLKDSQQLNLDTIAQNNLTRTQGREEAQYDNQLPIQQLLAALGLAKPGQIPGSTTAQTGGLNPVDIAGLFNNQYNGQVSGANAETAGANSTNGAIMGLIAAALPYLFASDHRLKKNLRRIGTSPKGYPWYSFSYIGESTIQQGVIAQEVLPHDPSAVILLPCGFYAVDYSKV